MEQLKAFFKWLLSFSKTDWEISDYPVRFREQGKDDPNIPRWNAQIVNWWVLTGVGETREEAYQNLVEIFKLAKETREKLPRPGMVQPIEFMSSKEILNYWGIVSRIIDEVLGLDPTSVFVSDGSSLWDFPFEDILDYHRKIEEIFGVDVSHIESCNLAEIAKYIDENS